MTVTETMNLIVIIDCAISQVATERLGSVKTVRMLVAEPKVC